MRKKDELYEKMRRVVKEGKTIVQSFVDHEVQTVDGLPGYHMLKISDTLQDVAYMNHILSLNELNVAFMIDAHDRLTGILSICLITAGSGATNGIIGLAQASSKASPVIPISGHC